MTFAADDPLSRWLAHKRRALLRRARRVRDHGSDGATRGQVRTQFLSEAVLLSLLGGIVGVALGFAATAVYASAKHWNLVVPPLAWAGGNQQFAGQGIR